MAPHPLTRWTAIAKSEAEIGHDGEPATRSIKGTSRTKDGELPDRCGTMLRGNERIYSLMEPISFSEVLILLGVATIVGSYVTLIHQWLKNADKE